MIEIFNHKEFEYLESENSLVIFNDCIETLRDMQDELNDKEKRIVQLETELSHTSEGRNPHGKNSARK